MWYMIVIHPKDPSTWMLELIYKNLNDIVVYDSFLQREELLSAIAATPRQETILLLGHGSSAGLLDKRFGLIIHDEDACILVNRPNLVGIWCYAADFARKHGLQGFFSGMFISEEREAIEHGITTTIIEINNKSVDFAQRFGRMLYMDIPLKDIAAEMMSIQHRDCDLTEFNYSRLTFIEETKR